MAHLHLATGDTSQAEKELQQALAMFPGYHYALGNLAKVRIQQKRYPEAVALLQQRYNAGPHAENLYELAVALQLAGRNDDAKKAFAEFEQKSLKETNMGDNSNHELIMYYADYANRPADALSVAQREMHAVTTSTRSIAMPGHSTRTASMRSPKADAGGARGWSARCRHVSPRRRDRAESRRSGGGRTLPSRVRTIEYLGLAAGARNPGAVRTSPTARVRREKGGKSYGKAHSFLLVIAFALFSSAAFAGTFPLSGHVLDPQGVAVTDAKVQLHRMQADSRSTKRPPMRMANSRSRSIPAGQYQLSAQSPSFVTATISVPVGAARPTEVTLQFLQIISDQQTVAVVATVQSILSPDPGRSVVLHDQVLDANPGRPGAPISIPGLPAETASGGIKAPQYFAPGVAGDHGEPIAQYYQIGDFLYPNNLPANAHGNGYADPNFLIAPTIEGVRVDGAAFNVREGNNSIDVAASYLPRQRVTSFFQLTGDYHDGDVMAGWGSANPATDAWIAGEASFGDGFLERLEHRQQYKLNGFRQFNLGRHQLTLFGVGYYGFSYIPGLIPINVPVHGDTIDNRQLDNTYTFLAMATDTWKLSEQRQLSFSGFYRNYALKLRSNFGDGLIQQSENRNVFGGEATYIQSVRPWLALLAGVDLRRDAPRNLDLKHVDDNGVFQPVTSNNLTLSFLEPFLSVDGPVGRYLHYNLGVRQEEVWMSNQDLIHPQNSFNRLATLTLPKGTLTILPPDRWYFPTVAFSYGEAFHTNDPRIGTGAGDPTLIAPSRAYQLVLSKVLKQTQFYVTLRRVSNSLELAKIDPDTGLQDVVGPSLNKVHRGLDAAKFFPRQPLRLLRSGGRERPADRAARYPRRHG